jgi:predicted HTH domain antitoxin
MVKQNASLDASFWINAYEADLVEFLPDYGVSEAALMRRFILEGLARYRLEEAIRAYANGEVDLSAAARHAGISVYQMMTELQRRDITPQVAREKFLDGLETLAETFGGSEALFRTIARMREQQEDTGDDA